MDRTDGHLGKLDVVLLPATVLALLATVVTAGTQEAAPMNIGSRLELFVDAYLIDAVDGVSRELHSPEPQEVAIVSDQPWDGKASHYVTVFQDGDIFRMYYRGMPIVDLATEAARPPVICLAESTDGIRWTRPDVGIFEYLGTKQNNFVWPGTSDPERSIASNFSVFKDPNPACPPDELYKGIGASPLHAIASPDGVHWRLLSPDPIITEGAFDSQNIAFYDTFRGEYRAYVRDFAHGVRTVRTCTSQDFLQWTTPEWCKYGDTPWEHLYTNATLPYFRAPQIFLSFPKRFARDRTKHAELPAKLGGVSEGVFMSSRDGLNFDRSFLGAWTRTTGGSEPTHPPGGFSKPPRLSCRSTGWSTTRTRTRNARSAAGHCGPTGSCP